jgi:threonine/homoserine/homoserine lactone efflux protein
MDFWQGVMVLTFVHLLAAAVPGPDVAFVTRQALVYGRKVGLLASLGTALGLAIHITYSAAGLAAVVVHSVAWMTEMKLVGGSYLIYRGSKGLRIKPPLQAREGANMGPIYFLSLFTIVLSPSMPLPTLMLYGVWLMMLHLIWFSMVTLCFMHTSVRARFLAVGHGIDRAFGVAMVSLGIRVLTSDYR